jgi:predicted DNA binding CopG/RHH family protein
MCEENTFSLNSNGMPQRKMIGIKVPLYVIDYFKEEAVRTGIPYQTLINLYLEDCVKQQLKLVRTWKSNNSDK